MPRGLAAARRRRPTRDAAVMRPSDQSGPTSTLWPRAPQLIDGRLGHAAFDHQDTRPCGARPERPREMLGMPGRGVDRLLQIHGAMHVAQEKLGDPLILAVAARRAPAQIRLALAQRERRRQSGARAPAGSERGGMAFLEPEHLRPRAEAEAELRNHRRRLQPAAGRRRGHHVAGVIDDVEMHGIAARGAEPAYGRLTGAGRRACSRSCPCGRRRDPLGAPHRQHPRQWEPCSFGRGLQ